MAVKTNPPSFPVRGLGPSRDHWWNRDFLDLMARRWRLNERRQVLDIGCGTGHWSQILLDYLPKEVSLCAVDIQMNLLQKARNRFNKTTCAQGFTVCRSDVYQLPFRSESFDMVTAQTLWIHLPDIPSALREVLRVLRPGGILTMAEPNNLAQQLFFNSLTKDTPTEILVEGIREAVSGERSKMIGGLGNDSAGPVLPEYLWKAGFCGIQAYLSDRIHLLYPPYNEKTQRRILREMKQWNKKNTLLWQAVERREFFNATPTLMMMISGEKPESCSGIQDRCI